MSKKTNSTKGETFEITNLNQICDIVNDDNIELLLMDFAAWLTYYHEAIKDVRSKHKKETKDLSNTQIAKAKFVWTDDGDNKITEVVIKDEKSGKVVTKKMD
jgi:hypothetical protein